MVRREGPQGADDGEVDNGNDVDGLDHQHQQKQKKQKHHQKQKQRNGQGASATFPQPAADNMGQLPTKRAKTAVAPTPGLADKKSSEKGKKRKKEKKKHKQKQKTAGIHDERATTVQGKSSKTKNDKEATMAKQKDKRETCRECGKTKKRKLKTKEASPQSSRNNDAPSASRLIIEHDNVDSGQKHKHKKKRKKPRRSGEDCGARNARKKATKKHSKEKAADKKRQSDKAAQASLRAICAVSLEPREATQQKAGENGNAHVKRRREKRSRGIRRGQSVDEAILQRRRPASAEKGKGGRKGRRSRHHKLSSKEANAIITRKLARIRRASATNATTLLEAVVAIPSFSSSKKVAHRHKRVSSSSLPEKGLKGEKKTKRSKNKSKRKSKKKSSKDKSTKDGRESRRGSSSVQKDDRDGTQKASNELQPSPLYQKLKFAVLDEVEGDSILRDVVLGNCYFKHGIALETDAVVVDVGAFVGMFSVQVLTQVEGAHVIAIEPLGQHFQLLMQNLVGNRKAFAPRARFTAEMCGLAMDSVPRLSLASYSLCPAESTLKPQEREFRRDKLMDALDYMEFVNHQVPRQRDKYGARPSSTQHDGQNRPARQANIGECAVVASSTPDKPTDPQSTANAASLLASLHSTSKAAGRDVSAVALNGSGLATAPTTSDVETGSTTETEKGEDGLTGSEADISSGPQTSFNGQSDDDWDALEREEFEDVKELVSTLKARGLSTSDIDEFIHAGKDNILSSHEPMETSPIQLRTLSGIITQHKLTRIDLLKVDCEGCELETLCGIDEEAGHWDIIQQVVMEVFTQERVDRIVDLLREKGFAQIHVEQQQPTLSPEGHLDFTPKCIQLFLLYARRN